MHHAHTVLVNTAQTAMQYYAIHCNVDGVRSEGERTAKESLKHGRASERMCVHGERVNVIHRLIAAT